MALDHMVSKHRRNRDGSIKEEEEATAAQPIEQLFNTAGEAARITSLVTQTSVDAMHAALITWIVLAHIALTCVEQQSFRDFCRLLNPALFQYLYKSGNTIRDLILQDFEERKGRVREVLRRSKSVIHISFDLWSAQGNSLAMLGIVAHYLDQWNVSQSLLIALRQLNGDHSGFNQSKTLVAVIKEFDLADRLGYFISDNVGSNDYAVMHTCEKLGIRDHVQRRLRCLGHIINLAAKALLYGKDTGSFDFEVSEMAQLRLEVRQALEVLAFWRKKGPIGKLHTIIIWILASPQRQEQFANMTVDLVEARNGQSRKPHQNLS